MGVAGRPLLGKAKAPLLLGDSQLLGAVVSVLHDATALHKAELSAEANKHLAWLDDAVERTIHELQHGMSPVDLSRCSVGDRAFGMVAPPTAKKAAKKTKRSTREVDETILLPEDTAGDESPGRGHEEGQCKDQPAFQADLSSILAEADGPRPFQESHDKEAICVGAGMQNITAAKNGDDKEQGSAEREENDEDKPEVDAQGRPTSHALSRVQKTEEHRTGKPRRILKIFKNPEDIYVQNETFADPTKDKDEREGELSPKGSALHSNYRSGDSGGEETLKESESKAPTRSRECEPDDSTRGGRRAASKYESSNVADPVDTHKLQTSSRGQDGTTVAVAKTIVDESGPLETSQRLQELRTQVKTLPKIITAPSKLSDSSKDAAKTETSRGEVEDQQTTSSTETQKPSRLPAKSSQPTNADNEQLQPGPKAQCRPESSSDEQEPRVSPKAPYNIVTSLPPQMAAMLGTSIVGSTERNDHADRTDSDAAAKRILDDAAAQQRVRILEAQKKAMAAAKQEELEAKQKRAHERRREIEFLERQKEEERLRRDRERQERVRKVLEQRKREKEELERKRRERDQERRKKLQEMEQRRAQRVQQAAPKSPTAGTSRNSVHSTVRTPGKHDKTDPNDDCYNMTSERIRMFYADCDSDEDERRRRKKKIPEWAVGGQLLEALKDQENKDPDRVLKLSNCEEPNLALHEVFTDMPEKPRYRKRTSSGNWFRDRLTWREELDYKRALGHMDTIEEE